MKKRSGPKPPGPLTKQFAADLKKRWDAAGLDQWTAKELADRQGASIAQDPVAALFNGVRFHKKTDRPRLEQEVRSYCYKQIGDNWTANHNKFDTERSQLRLQISILEEALRTAKRNSASEVIEATRGRVGSEAMGLAVGRG